MSNIFDIPKEKLEKNIKEYKELGYSNYKKKYNIKNNDYDYLSLDKEEREKEYEEDKEFNKKKVEELKNIVTTGNCKLEFFDRLLKLSSEDLCIIFNINSDNEYKHIKTTIIHYRNMFLNDII